MQSFCSQTPPFTTVHVVINYEKFKQIFFSLPVNDFPDKIRPELKVIYDSDIVSLSSLVES